MLADDDGLVSLTLMSSGPAALTGPRAAELRGLLATLGAGDGRMPEASALRARISDMWQAYLEPQFVEAGVPGPIVAFLARRMRSNDPGRPGAHGQASAQRAEPTAELARRTAMPLLVLYGEDDNSWSPAAQEAMARRLAARRVCIPAASHSPAVEAPATTAGALTQFSDAAEVGLVPHAVSTPLR